MKMQSVQIQMVVYVKMDIQKMEQHVMVGVSYIPIIP